LDVVVESFPSGEDAEDDFEVTDGVDRGRKPKDVAAAEPGAESLSARANAQFILTSELRVLKTIQLT
jgi:hypothetical protein